MANVHIKNNLTGFCGSNSTNGKGVCMYVCHLFSVNLLQDMEIVTLLTIGNTAT